MISLSRQEGPTALLDVAFKQGNMAGALTLMRIRRELRKGDVSRALERATRYVGKSSKARTRAKAGRPFDESETRLATGQLLYSIGEPEAALAYCILPEVEAMMKREDYAHARLGLQDVLRAEPGCDRAKDLQERLPADYR